MEWHNAAQYLSPVLSTLTIASCVFLKVPQIHRIQKTRRTEGLNLRAIFFEICSYSVNMLYQYCNNFATLTYLEYPIVLVQLYVLMYYVLRHRNKHHNPMVFFGVMVYTLLMIGFATKCLSTTILNCVQPFSTPFSMIAKIQYIRGIIAERNADNISLVTWVISVLTNMARIYTVAMDTMDYSMLANYSLSSLLSSLVLLTAMTYQFNKRAPPTNPDPTDIPRSRRKSTRND